MFPPELTEPNWRSDGTATRFAWLWEQPFRRDALVLCSAATPAGQLERLRRHRVGYAVLSETGVDLVAALRVLAARGTREQAASRHRYLG
jgi:riboflavin biosynthesis pyrimidine reductase